MSLTVSRPPTFIIAGAMRCGTSSLNAYLRAHPEVSVSRPKEVHFFDVNYHLGLQWYLQHFAVAENIRAVGEATPDYLYDLEAPGRIADTLPDIRILLLLREPAERAYSHYWHNVSVGKEDQPFEAALEAEEERISAGPLDRATYSYVDRGRYAIQIERLLEQIPTEQVLIQTFDELTRDPASVYRRSCAFIGVDSQHVPENLGSTVNAFVGYRSTGLRNLTKRLPKRVTNAVARINRIEKGPYEPMSNVARSLIRTMTAEDASRLERVAGIEVPWLHQPPAN